MGNESIDDIKAEMAETLRRADSRLRRARIALIIVVLLMVSHFEYLVFPYALSRLPRLDGILILLYPVFFGALNIAGVFAGNDPKITKSL